MNWALSLSFLVCLFVCLFVECECYRTEANKAACSCHCHCHCHCHWPSDRHASSHHRHVDLHFRICCRVRSPFDLSNFSLFSASSLFLLPSNWLFCLSFCLALLLITGLSFLLQWPTPHANVMCTLSPGQRFVSVVVVGLPLTSVRSEARRANVGCWWWPSLVNWPRFFYLLFW